MARPSDARSPACRIARTHAVSFLAYTISRTTTAPGGSSSGRGCPPRRPSGVESIMMHNIRWPGSRDAQVSRPREKMRRRQPIRTLPPPGHRERGQPPRPPARRHRFQRSTSLLAARRAGQCSGDAGDIGILAHGFAVIRPERVACSEQFPPCSRHRSTERAAASLCGTVTLPPPPERVSAAMSDGRSFSEQRSGTYTAGRPRAWKVAPRMGRRERMRDGIAEDGEDARVAVDHRTVRQPG